MSEPKLRKNAKKLSDTIVYAVLAVLGVLWVLPIFYLLYTAFRVRPDTGIINQLFPENLKLGVGNFKRLLGQTDFTRWLLNTLFVSACSCLLTTLWA